MSRPRRKIEEAPGVEAGPDRVLGRLTGDRPGPTLICVGGLHGNEPAGIRGIRRVLEVMERRGPDLAGEFLALSGNRTALARGCRFVDLDLNRAWTPEWVRARGNDGRSPAGPGVESREQAQLLRVVEEAEARARGPIYLLDLHTTSGAGGIFASVGDTLRNRAFAMAFPAPLILGLEELVEGTLVEYFEGLGYICAAFESGQHDNPRSVGLAEAAIWIALEASGVLHPDEVPEAADARRRMARACAGLPRVLEMRYRHPVTPSDRFLMDPGYRNFQPVEEGQPVARDRHGRIRAPEGGRLLMPLYQEQGDDGFFVIREFNAVWLRISAILRKLRMDRIVHWLPGIRRDPDHPAGEALIVDRRVARWHALDLLHLLGYRRHRERGEELVVLRRRFDVSPTAMGGGEIPPHEGGPEDPA